MRLHRHTHTHTDKQTHTHMHALTHTHVNTHMYTHRHTHTHTSSVTAALIIGGILIQHITTRVTLPGNGHRIKATTVGVGTWVNLQLGHAS